MEHQCPKTMAIQACLSSKGKDIFSVFLGLIALTRTNFQNNRFFWNFFEFNGLNQGPFSNEQTSLTTWPLLRLFALFGLINLYTSEGTTFSAQIRAEKLDANLPRLRRALSSPTSQWLSWTLSRENIVLSFGGRSLKEAKLRRKQRPSITMFVLALPLRPQATSASQKFRPKQQLA